MKLQVRANNSHQEEEERYGPPSLAPLLPDMSCSPHLFWCLWGLSWGHAGAQPGRALSRVAQAQGKSGLAEPQRLEQVGCGREGAFSFLSAMATCLISSRRCTQLHAGEASVMRTIQKKKKHDASSYSSIHHTAMQLHIYRAIIPKQLTVNIRSAKDQRAHDTGARVCFTHFSRELDQRSCAGTLAILDL